MNAEKIKEGLKRCAGKDCHPTKCPYAKEDYCNSVLHKETLELIEYYESHIEAFMRDQEPKKVRGDMIAFKYALCPKCMAKLTEVNKYCSNCGQALDWTGDEE